MQSRPSLLQSRLSQDLEEFRANPPVPGARAVLFMDDIAVILPPELSLDTGLTVVRQGMRVVGVPVGTK